MSFLKGDLYVFRCGGLLRHQSGPGSPFLGEIPHSPHKLQYEVHVDDRWICSHVAESLFSESVYFSDTLLVGGDVRFLG